MEVDFKVYLGSISRDVHSCTHWLRPRNSLTPPAFELVLQRRYWSAKIDDIFATPAAPPHPPTGPMYFVFCRLYPYHLSHHGTLWILPATSRLLLSNTVSRVRACLIL